MDNSTVIPILIPPLVESIPLHFWTCFFLNSDTGRFSTKSGLEFYCRTQGKYLLGWEYGRIASVAVLLLIYVVGFFGFVTNILNVCVLRRSLKGASVSMKRLLIMLAVFELFACFFSIVFSTIIVMISENVNRSQSILVALKVFNIFFSFGRTAAIYITILVTVERYLVVAFPLKSKSWLTPGKSKIYLAAVIIFSALVDFPWILNATVTENSYASLAPNTSLAEFPYIFNITWFGRNIYSKMRIPLLFLNFAAPFPLLLIFNALLYKSIYNWHKSRSTITRTQKKEISAAKMFSIVVLVLLLCHTVSCVIFFSTQIFKVVHRELLLLQNFCTTLSAGINFIVYYTMGKAFRQEFKRLVNSNWAKMRGLPPPESSGQRTSRSGDSSAETEEQNGQRTSVMSCC